VHDGGEARELVALAERRAWCMASALSIASSPWQQAAAMMRQQVGRLFAAHGSYLQDWMLLETDYNWRVDSAQGGASRAVADIGSHWCDTVQFMTGRRIVEVMADLSIVWPTRKASVAGNRPSAHDERAAYEINRSYRRLWLGAVSL
jgi:predicted dehydrogenase